ncbi:MAG: cbb3-type cytochrome c oxidase subunit II [Planctomycetaceae bacterium]|nr:cbb3-type cytochrome c oxidase subunit II [Planctomycetaceae bacterium]
MFESKSGIFYVAGLGFFALAFVSNALVPWLMYDHIPEKTVAELVNSNLRYQFEDLARRYPESFTAVYGEIPGGDAEHDAWWNEKCGEALEYGRKIYVGEGCWHCHSQFIRPVSNEESRWGDVSHSEEYQNVLQRPVLFGTRRVGPDLIREGGRRSNDWHAVHFFKPVSVSEGSPMPNYPWFFDGSADKPNKEGLAILTYIQWLGSWKESYPYYEAYVPSALIKPEPAEGEAAAADAAANADAAAAPADAAASPDAAAAPADAAASAETKPAEATPAETKPEEAAPAATPDAATPSTETTPAPSEEAPK